MRKSSNRQWYNSTCVTGVFAMGLILGNIIRVLSSGLLQDVIFISVAVLAFHISNIITDVISRKQ